jgi:hypothetical protein
MNMKPLTVVALVSLAALVAMPLLSGDAAAEVVRSGTGCLRVSTGILWKITEGPLPLSPCVAGEVIAHLSGGDITEVATPATGGLQGGTDNDAASLSLQPSFRLPQTCTPGQVPRWDGTSWECGPGGGGGGLARLEDLNGLPCGAGAEAGTVSLTINPLSRSVSLACPRIGEFQLDVAVSGLGTVTSAAPDIACGNGLADCSHSYPAGEVVTLNAADANSDTHFFGWGGACGAQGATPACDVTMDQARLVTALFGPTLSLALGTVASDRVTSCAFNICLLFDVFTESRARVTVTDIDTSTDIGVCDANTAASVQVAQGAAPSFFLTHCDVPILPGHHLSLRAEDSTTLGGIMNFAGWADGGPCEGVVDPVCTPAAPVTVHLVQGVGFH